MSLPHYLFDKAVERFERKFLFVYSDSLGRYGICSACGNAVPYDEPLPSAQGGDQFRYTDCPHCNMTLEVRRGWYGKHSLKDRFYLQAWEVIDYNTVKLHEAIIALDGRTDTDAEAGSWENKTCWDQRCTTVTPGHCETIRWDGQTRRVSSICPPFEQYGSNIIPLRSPWHIMTDQVCVLGLGSLKQSFVSPFLETAAVVGIRQEEVPNYIFRMVEEPITELFLKAGFLAIAHERAFKHRPNHGTRHIDFSQRSPKKMFRGLSKNCAVQKMKELLRLMPNNTKIWQLEKCAEMFTNGTLKKPEDAALFCRIDTYEYAFDGFLEDMRKYGYPANRFIRYLGSHGESVRYYTDYLKLAEELGKPTHESRTLFPDDLHAAHDDLVAEKQYMYDKKTEENAKKRRAELVAAGYEFKSGTLCTVVPKNAEDIKAEGKALRHCVGRYAEDHANGKSTIIFIRHTDDPKTPFFTLEVDSKRLFFVQCYGYANQVKGVNSPEVAPFLEKYAKHLKSCMNKKKKQEDKKCRKTA